MLQYCCHNTGFNHRDFKFSVLNLKKNSSNLLNNLVTLAGTGILPEDDLLSSKHVGVPLNISMYFNEIDTLD